MASSHAGIERISEGRAAAGSSADSPPVNAAALLQHGRGPGARGVQERREQPATEALGPAPGPSRAQPPPLPVLWAWWASGDSNRDSSWTSSS
eukprot:7330395-Lingulodinium_polyedra.AAC.1